MQRDGKADGPSITAAAMGGNSNTNLNLTNVLAMVSSTATPFALSATGVVSPLVNPYGLTIGVMITRNGAGTTTGDLNLQVPEPASIALFGLDLAFVVLLPVHEGLHALAYRSLGARSVRVHTSARLLCGPHVRRHGSSG